MTHQDTPMSARRRRWQVLPPEGEGECDYNPEYEAAHPDVKPSVLRANAASYQAKEAIRLAKEYALLRPGTRKEEIKLTRVEEARSAAAAWQRLVRELCKRRRP